jgi:translocation and assembly module TamB
MATDTPDERPPEGDGTEEVNGEAIDNQEPEESPRRRGWLSRRNVLIAAGIPLALLVILAAVVFFFIRFGYAGRYIEARFVEQMAKIGVRTEIGQFEQTFSPLGTRIRDVKFYDQATNELLAQAKEIQLDATVTDLLAPNLNRTVRLDSMTVTDLEAWVRFDAEGRSNFSRLKIPEQEESNLRFNFETMKFRLNNALIHYGDSQRKLSGDAHNVAIFVEPDEGLSETEREVENRRFKFEISAANSLFTVHDQDQPLNSRNPTIGNNDRPIEPIDVNVRGIATETYAEIAELNLKTPFTESRLNGRLENWEKLKYKLNIVSTVDLQKTGETFKAEQALRGFGNLTGVVEGEGDKYTVTAEVTSDALAADNVRLKGLRVDASVSGQADAYEANGKAVAEMLNAGDFELDTLQLAGKVMGTGTDFRWLGDLQAAAARVPGATIANLILADAQAEYKDNQLTANVGRVAADSLDGFDAKVRALRASGAKIRNASDTTDIQLASVNADSVQAQSANLRGVNASDVRIRNGARTDVEIGRVQAQSLDAQGANVRGLTAANVDVTTSGATTDITAQTVQVGGVTTAQAVLGSLNIAGVRLKIVGERIEGETGNINAGNIALNKSRDLPQGGRIENVRVVRPRFVVEPSGRYRASADLSLGGGVLGTVNLGAARAAVTATNGQVDLRNLNAQVLDGNLNGDAVITYEGRAATRINAAFDNLDVAKILALQGGQVVPLAGKTTGRVDLTFPGLNYKSASGTVSADVTAEAGSDERGRVPLTGRLDVRADNGLFNVETANFKTNASEFTANGRFDLEGSDSNLNIALNSTDARELQQIISVLNVAPDVDKQLAENRIEIGGNFNFNGTLTGNLNNPNVQGRATLDSISANNRFLGSLTTDLSVQGKDVALNNGRLAQANGGNVTFNVGVPGSTNNISINAELNNVDVGNLIAAAPNQDSLPAFLKNISAATSGTINLTGVPNNINGLVELRSKGGSIGGERFDSLTSRVVFESPNINIERIEARAGNGVLTVSGNYLGEEARFNLNATGTNLPVERFRGFFGENPPNIAGVVNFKAQGAGDVVFTETGAFDTTGTLQAVNISFDGSGQDITIDNRAIGSVAFTGKTENQILTANVTGTFGNQEQTVLATVNFGNENLPFRAETVFNNTDLAPYAAIFQDPRSVALGGRATGRATFGGNLRTRNAEGELVFSTADLSGEASFTALTLQVEDTALSIAEPTTVRFSSSQVTFENTRLVGSGSNIVINGTAVFMGEGASNLGAEGTINLRVLNAFSNNQFFGGLATVAVRVTGSSSNVRLSGSAAVDNASFTTIISNERTTFTNIKGRVLFNANQAQIENLQARLGGGTVTASGGIVFSNNLQIQAFRLDVRGDDVSARLPQDFRTTGDAVIQVSGVRRQLSTIDPRTGRNEEVIQSIISGNIYATRGEYNREIELVDLISSRRSGAISTGVGESILGTPQLDLRITGRDALIVRNETADLVGSLDLRITGDINEPLIGGRISVTSGSIVLLNDVRYDVTRATIDFPGQLDASPVVNFQGEADIAGYQVFLIASGAVSDANNLSITVRSNPALPQADVVSLITTGALTNADGGIGTLAQTGLNTAADLVTDALINEPIRKATDRLFGLNRFELNPVLAGQRGIEPGARLTVGRQINRNLSVTYSTNLSADRNQVLALVYRVSNRVSFVAQYEQAPLSNVTQRRDNFSFEVRFRRRF